MRSEIRWDVPLEIQVHVEQTSKELTTKYTVQAICNFVLDGNYEKHHIYLLWEAIDEMHEEITAEILRTELLVVIRECRGQEFTNEWRDESRKRLERALRYAQRTD